MIGGAPRELLLQLQSILADLYRTNDRALEVADRAGLAVGGIAQSPYPKSTWWGILREAVNQLALDKIIELARQDYPRHEGLRLAAAGALADVSGPEVEWLPPAVTNEVIIGADDLLPAAFLEVGGQIAKSVVRIALGRNSFGSGFLIAKDFVLTNHHVLPTLEVARDAVVELGCQETLEGVAIAGTPHATRADDLFVSDAADDWAVVRIDGIADCVPIALGADRVARVGERVYIIQHPGGGPKQVALGVNTVMFVDDRRIQYLTDTRPGSSGSPVFDRSWQLVGLHHSGGWLSDPGTKQRRFRNEGIAIGAVYRGLVAAKVVP
jgi:S1-C subfamily serine protease